MTCTICHETKDDDAFPSNGDKRGGRRHQCKECMRKINAQWRKEKKNPKIKKEPIYEPLIRIENNKVYYGLMIVTKFTIVNLAVLDDFEYVELNDVRLSKEESERFKKFCELNKVIISQLSN